MLGILYLATTLWRPYCTPRPTNATVSEFINDADSSTYGNLPHMSCSDAHTRLHVLD